MIFPLMKIDPLLLKIHFFLAGFALVLMSTLASSGTAEEIGLTARVDKNQVSLEDTIQLSLIVNGVMSAPEPQLPHLPGFRVRSSSMASSSRIINGQKNISVTHNYQLIPLRPGTFVIEPAILELGGRTYQSEPITILVSKPDSNRPKTTSPAYVETFVSNANPYVNEQTIYTFKLYRRVEAKNFNLAMSYEDSDFRKEDMGDAKTYSQILNGVQYNVHELSTALYPIHSGKVEIPPAILELDLLYRRDNSSRRNPLSGLFKDPFFNSRASLVHKTLRAQPIPITVRPLPKNNRPKKFSNIVGGLTISANLGKNELKVGDTTTLTVTVKGPGSVKDLSLSLPEMQDRFKIYPDQPDSKLTIAGNTFSGEKIFKFALVPLVKGVHTVPAIALPFFDPVKNLYRNAKTTPIALTILPTADPGDLKFAESPQAKEQGTNNSVQTLGEDILPIHTQLSDFDNYSVNEPNHAMFAGAMIFPPILFLLFTAYVRYNQRLRYDIAFVRNRKAFKEANKKLKRLSQTSDSNPQEFVKILSEIFREYIGNKLNLQGKAITSLEVERKLLDRKYSREQAQLTRTLLEKYESLQYAPPNNLKNNNDLIDESLNLLNQLEKQA